MKHIRLIAILVLIFWGNSIAQTVVKVSNVAFTVSDLVKSRSFLEETVDAVWIETLSIDSQECAELFAVDKRNLPIKIARLKIGNEEIRLLEFNESEGREILADSKSNDLWFQHIAIVVAEMETAYEHVYQNNVKHVSTSPQTLPNYIPAAAGITAFYFRDIDEHNLELIHFPDGKGNLKWKTKSEDTFLGIDHTAIAVSNTEQSLRFYRDLLGLSVQGNSENFGPEQERLNQVFGARLMITGLAANEGFGVEFLEYIAPPGGRLFPDDSSTLDLWHWHTSMCVDDLTSIVNKLNEQDDYPNYKITEELKDLGYDRAVLIRDPDGHAILLYEKKEITKTNH